MINDLRNWETRFSRWLYRQSAKNTLGRMDITREPDVISNEFMSWWLDDRIQMEFHDALGYAKACFKQSQSWPWDGEQM